MNIQLFYNKKLLAKLGLDPAAPPATWKEFLSVAKLAKAQGLIGFVSGWAELWLIDCFATNYAIHQMGMDKVEATYRGKVPYTDSDWVKVLGLFEELRQSGLAADGIVTLVNKRSEQLFANERAVFAFNGTWGVNVYRSMNPGLDYGVMMPPPLSRRPMVTWGGAGSSFFVNARSPRRAEAVAFLHWLTAEPQQRYLTEVTQNIPATRAAAATLPAQLAAFADDMDATVHPRLFSVQEDSTVIEAFDKGIQSILIGEAGPDQVAQQVHEVKRRSITHQAHLEAAHAVK
jgi:raffinose/stachyose/melibiose transport system substrate-binding protein